MRVLINRPAPGHARFAGLIALALLLKALVPAGWMPVIENGGVALRLCSGWAPAPVEQPAFGARHALSIEPGASMPSSHREHRAAQDAAAAPAHDDRHGEEQQSSDHLCSFAAAGLSWTFPGQAGAAEPLRRSAELAPPLAFVVAVGRGLAAPPPPSTGPPILT